MLKNKWFWIGVAAFLIFFAPAAIQPLGHLVGGILHAAGDALTRALNSYNSSH